MRSLRITLTATIAALVLSSPALMSIHFAAALAATSTASSTTTLASNPQVIAGPSQALPGQGSIVPLGSSSGPVVLPSLATTTAAGTTTVGLGILSEHNRLGITASSSCVVTQSSNAKQCDIYVTYTTATGEPVIGIPVTIRTMNGDGIFTDYNGPLFVKEGPGKIVQYSGVLPGTQAEDVATYVGPASATSTLFVVTTPDGLRAQSTFASSTSMR
jgi:hypothetical protein